MSKPKVQFCPRGHDTFICGKDKWRSCNDCNHEKYRRTNKIVLRVKNIEVICVKGHNKDITGRTSDGGCLLCHTEYMLAYNKRTRERRNAHARDRYKNDVVFKLSLKIRNRVNAALKKNKKISSAVRLLGCSLDFLKQYISSQFREGMTWDNWGTVWELDHIEALWKFDLEDPIQFKQAVHYINLQPLTIPEHKFKTSNEARERIKFQLQKRGSK